MAERKLDVCFALLKLLLELLSCTIADEKAMMIVILKGDESSDDENVFGCACTSAPLMISI